MNCSSCRSRCPCPQACLPARPVAFRPDYELRGPYMTAKRSRRRRLVRRAAYIAACLAIGGALFLFTT
jgi:hypothetical protein